ncbi:hypothetical protein SCUP234_11930 [Seiridium cupressi]
MREGRKTEPGHFSVTPRRSYSAEDMTTPPREHRIQSCKSSETIEPKAFVNRRRSLSPANLNQRISFARSSPMETQKFDLQSKLSEAEENTQEALTQLEKEKKEKQKAQDRAQQLLTLNESLERRVSELSTEVDGLNNMLHGTKIELKDTRAHILSLQPYLKDIAPEEIGRDFDDLYSAACDWVEKWLTPVFDDEDTSDEILQKVRNNTLKAAGLRKMMKGQPDLIYATRFSDTDQDVIVGMMMRFLHHEVFSKVLYEAVGDIIKTIQTLEDSMRTHVQPQRDLFAVRNWRAETLNSLVNHPEFESERDQRRVQLTLTLGKPLLLFHPQNPDDIYRNLEKDIIEPALRLQEKMETSINHFYFELNPYRHSNPDHPRVTMLLNEWGKVGCEDLFGNRKRVDLGTKSREEVMANLYPVCVICPRLMMRQVGRGNVIREPTIIRKQKALAAWGDSQFRQQRLREEPQSFLNAIIHAKSVWNSRGGEGGFFSGWV